MEVGIQLMRIQLRYFSGITYQRVRRFNANCHILVIDMAGKRFHVTPYAGLKVVSQVGT